MSAEAEVLGGEDVHNHNTFEQPNAVTTKKAGRNGLWKSGAIYPAALLGGSP